MSTKPNASLLAAAKALLEWYDGRRKGEAPDIPVRGGVLEFKVEALTAAVRRVERANKSKKGRPKNRVYPDPIGIPCPSCGAERGFWCRTTAEVRRAIPHLARRPGHPLTAECPVRVCMASVGRPCRDVQGVHLPAGQFHQKRIDEANRGRQDTPQEVEADTDGAIV